MFIAPSAMLFYNKTLCSALQSLIKIKNIKITAIELNKLIKFFKCTLRKIIFCY